MNSNSDVIAVLCQRIKIARISQNLSQAALAEKAQLGIATIKRVELGESITLLTLIAILRALGELEQLNNLLRYYELPPSHHLSARKRVTSVAPPNSPSAKSTPPEHNFITAQQHIMRWRNQ